MAEQPFTLRTLATGDGATRQRKLMIAVTGDGLVIKDAMSQRNWTKIGDVWLIEYPYIGEIFLRAGHVADGVDAGHIAGRPLTDNWLNTFYNANTTRSR